ncbi:MAG: hypothetical protein IJ808_01005, partial [Muribaculaceae bacterium]|nr:hypothetical protein [Muribaculaceae bacterium]
WAEKFERPLDPAVITKLGALFLANTSFKQDTTIVMSVHKVGDDGFPGEMLASASKVLSGCKVSGKDNVTEQSLTEFVLPQQVAVDEPFFVVISGIPAYEMNHAGVVNQVILGCSPLGDASKGDKNTAYLYLDSLKTVNNTVYFINKFHWEENSSSPISIALCPYLKFNTVSTPPPASAITEVQTEEGVEAHGEEMYYDLNGRRIVGVPEKGFYIVRRGDGSSFKLIEK